MYPTSVPVNSVRGYTPAAFPFRSCFRRIETFRCGLFTMRFNSSFIKSQIKTERDVSTITYENV